MFFEKLIELVVLIKTSNESWLDLLGGFKYKASEDKFAMELAGEDGGIWVEVKWQDECDDDWD